MSMILAGAAKGLGMGLLQEAQNQKQKALEEWKSQNELDQYEKKLEIKNGFKGGKGKLGTGKAGIGASGTGLKLNNQGRDDLSRIHKSNLETEGSYGENPPSEAQIMAWVETNADPNMSIAQAAEAARKAWQGDDTTETPAPINKQAYNPMLGGDDTYTELQDEVDVPHAGFGQPSSSGGLGAALSGPAQAAGPAQPKSKAEFDALPSGTRFIDPRGVERTKP